MKRATKEAVDAFVQCERKVRFPNEEAARRRRQSIRDRGGPNYRIYYCKRCSGYHFAKPSNSLGKKPGGKNHDAPQ